MRQGSKAKHLQEVNNLQTFSWCFFEWSAAESCCPLLSFFSLSFSLLRLWRCLCFLCSLSFSLSLSLCFLCFLSLSFDSLFDFPAIVGIPFSAWTTPNKWTSTSPMAGRNILKHIAKSGGNILQGDINLGTRDTRQTNKLACATESKQNQRSNWIKTKQRNKHQGGRFLTGGRSIGAVSLSWNASLRTSRSKGCIRTFVSLE